MPFYAVEPILKYIPQEWAVWCPFDEKWAAYVRLLRENGRRVVRSSLSDGQDFFSYEPEEWDVIVSNPPFSKKDRVLERLYSLGKPFAVLLPLAALQGRGRYRHLKNGVELLAFDRRISFYMEEKAPGRHPGVHLQAPISAAASFRKNWSWKKSGSMTGRCGNVRKLWILWNERKGMNK